MSRILIVEDEAPIADGIAFNLRRQGYEVEIARDGESALANFRQQHPDLVLLDVMLPGLDGYSVCRMMRREADVPVIMLTARAEQDDKVVGFDVGADDYVTKPFHMEELIARVKAVLRRSSVPRSRDEKLEAPGLIVDVASRTVTREGQELRLSKTEFDLLRVFMSGRGRVYTREDLLSLVWGEESYVDTHTVDVHVYRLRDKLEEDPQKPRYIQTVRGVGYKFVA